MRWLTPEELSAWLVYVATTSLLDGALDRQLQRESGMPMAYYLILAMLSACRAAMRWARPSPPSRGAERLRRGSKQAPGGAPLLRTTGAARSPNSPTQAWSRSRRPRPARARRAQHVFDRLTPEQVGQLREIFATVMKGSRRPTPVPPPGTYRDTPQSDAHRNPRAARHGQRACGTPRTCSPAMDVPLGDL